MGRGGAAWAKRELGWDRTTVRKGLHELESGVVCFDHVGLRGRKVPARSDQQARTLSYYG